MRILVLGGTGFIGSHLVERLSGQRHKIRVLTRSTVQPEHFPGIDYFQGDFGCKTDVALALEGIDVVIHCISTTVPRTSNLNPIADIETNLINSVNLLQAMSQANVKRIIYLSSGGTVYGVPSSLPITEDHPKQPICSYGIVKLAIENYLHLFKDLYGISSVVLRPSNPFGPGQKRLGVQGAISTFMDRVLKSEPIQLWGDGSVVRDYIYIPDLIDACVLALNSTTEGVFNIGTSVGYSLAEIITILEKTIGKKAIVEFNPERGFDVKEIILDINLAKEKLGWQPKYSIEQGIKLYFESYGLSTG